MVGFICRVCYKFGDVTDLRRSSRNVIDSAIFVALSTGLGLCKDEHAKNFYRELRLQCGYVCMQHFQDTAQSLYDEMIATRGSFPDILPSTSAESDAVTCARIRPYDVAFSTDVLRGIRRVVKEIDESVKICQTDLIMYISKAKEKGYIRDRSCDSKSLEPAKRLKWKKYEEEPPLLQKVWFNSIQKLNSFRTLPVREDSEEHNELSVPKEEPSLEATVPKEETHEYAAPPLKKPRTELNSKKHDETLVPEENPAVHSAPFPVRTTSPLPLHKKPVCYAVIPLWDFDVDVKKKLTFCLIDNGFYGMMFFNDLRDHPSVKPYFTGYRPEHESQEHEQTTTSLHSTCPGPTERVASTPLFEGKVEKCDEATTAEPVTFMTIDDVQMDRDLTRVDVQRHGGMDVPSTTYSEPTTSDLVSKTSTISQQSVKEEPRDCEGISAADLMANRVIHTGIPLCDSDKLLEPSTNESREVNLLSLREFSVYHDWPVIASMSDDQFDSFLADRGLLWRHRKCPTCNQPCFITREISKKSCRVRLKFECNRGACRNPGVKRKIGYLKGTFFENSRENRKKIFLASYFFINDMGTVKDRAHSCDVTPGTICQWDQWFRDIVVSRFLSESAAPIKTGASDEIVKVGEPYIVKRKYNRKWDRNTLWTWQTDESKFYLLWKAIAERYPITYE